MEDEIETPETESPDEFETEGRLNEDGVREEIQVVIDDKEIKEPGDGPDSPTPETVGEPEKPGYEPNFGYRVLKEDKEIPEFLRPLVKDQESEKAIRELCEKADGIDVVKSHRDQIQKDFQGFKEEWAPYIIETQGALKAMQAGDLRTFFEKVGLSDDAIFQYTKAALDLRKDPALYAAHEQRRTESLRARDLESQYSDLETRYQQVALRQHEQELSYSMERPEIRDVVSAFNERLGSPGAFRSEVVRIAQGYAARGQDLPVETVVNHVAQQFIKMSGWSAQPKPAAQPAPSPSAPGIGRRETKTIPNITGKATSPAKRIPKTLDDLRKLGEEMSAAENS